MKPIAASLVAGLMLTGCGPTFPTIDSAALAEAVAQVRGFVVEKCNYWPSDESLVAVLTQPYPIIESARVLGQKICDAVTATVPPLTPAQMQTPKAGEENQCPMVRGHCITGRFIQPKDGPEIHPPAPGVTP